MKTARRIAEMKALTTICFVATAVMAVATGSVPWMIASVAAIFGAALLPVAVGVVNAVLEARREDQASSASEAPGREVQPDVEECLDEIKAFYARPGHEPESGGGRFRELVSAEDGPGWSRLH
jgi:hypothetical protein